MIFNNSGSVPPQFNNVSNTLAKGPVLKVAPRNMSLNAPMIDRVHKAKPGCSACGKKVA